MIERLTLVGLVLALCIAAVLCWFAWLIVSPYIVMIRQAFSVVFVVFVGCVLALLVGGSYQSYRLLRIFVDHKEQHINLLTWGPGHGALLIRDEGPYHASAMHESAAISTYALEQESGRVEKQRLLEEAKGYTFAPKDDESKITEIKNLLTQGKSERQIAAITGISRHHQRKLLDK